MLLYIYFILECPCTQQPRNKRIYVPMLSNLIICKEGGVKLANYLSIYGQDNFRVLQRNQFLILNFNELRYSLF